VHTDVGVVPPEIAEVSPELGDVVAPDTGIVVELDIVLVVELEPGTLVVAPDGTIVVVDDIGMVEARHGAVVGGEAGTVVVTTDAGPMTMVVDDGGTVVVVTPGAAPTVVVGDCGTVVVVTTVARATVVVGDGGTVVVVATGAPATVVVGAGTFGIVATTPAVGTVVVGRTGTVGIVLTTAAAPTVVVGDNGTGKVVPVMTWFVTDTSVTPGPVLIETVPSVRLGLPTIRSGGSTRIAATCMPAGMDSATRTGVFRGKVPARTQLPAGTVTARPATVNAKGVPSTTPLPAILHTLTALVCTWFVKVTVASCVRPPGTTRTWAERADKSLPMSRAAGDVVTPVTRESPRSASVTVTTPTGTSITGEQPPTATAVLCPATVNVNVPVRLLDSDRLQICREPRCTDSFVNVTSVAPGPIATVAVPSVGLGVPTTRSTGTTPIAVTRVPCSNTSATATLDPYGKVPAWLHAPAGTAMACPPARNVKFVPGVIPVPATLQTVRVPSSTLLVNVAIVWLATPPATTVTWTERVATERLRLRSAGSTAMSVTPIPATASSVMRRLPAAT
jgi:hypothetical protein